MIRARVSLPKKANKTLKAALLAAAEQLADDVVTATDAPAQTYDLTLHELPDPEP